MKVKKLLKHSSSPLGFGSFCSGLFGLTIHSLLLVLSSSELGCQRCFFVQLFRTAFYLKLQTVELWSSRTLDC